MSNACIKALGVPQLKTRFAASAANSLSCRGAFYSRFYTLVTGARPEAHLSHQAFLPHRRALHDSSTCLAAARRPIPRRRPPPRPGSDVLLKELGSREISAVFGAPVGQTLGNRILRTLHQRRVNGSIIEHGVKIDDSHLPMEALLRALKWLRERYPVDEQTTATEWAEREAEKLQDSYISRAERLGLVKRTSQEEIEDREQEEQGPAYSVIDQMKKYKKQQEEAEQRRRIVSGEARRSEELRLAKVEEQRDKQEQHQRALEVHREKQYAAGMVTELEQPPEMTKTQRLVPSTLLALALGAGFLYFANTYTPPTYEQRLFKSLTPSWATCATIVAACTTVTCLWHVPAMWRTFNKYLITVPAMPYPASILGNVFSHSKFTHLAFNMGFMLFYGLPLHDMVGRGNFLTIYCLGGVLGSMTSLYWFVLRGVLTTYSSGASGAVFALVAAWALLNLDRDTSEDNERRFALDVARYCLLVVQLTMHFAPGISGYVDVASHAGGAATGVVGAVLLQMRARQTEEERPRVEVAAAGHKSEDK